MNYVMIPAFIVTALDQSVKAGVVPSIREGAGGNSHSTWLVKFSIYVDGDGGRMSKYHDFEVKITSSYSQKFLDFALYGDDAPSLAMAEFKSMADCVGFARSYVARLTA